jgi:hypothetical protein
MPSNDPQERDKEKGLPERPVKPRRATFPTLLLAVAGCCVLSLVISLIDEDCLYRVFREIAEKIATWP